MRERYPVAPKTPQSSEQEIDYESLHGGDYDIFPQFKQQVYHVNKILRGIVKGEVEVEALDQLLENPEVNTAFTTEQVIFGNKSYLSKLRSVIETEKQIGQKGR